jgi:hypothetical protein
MALSVRRTFLAIMPTAPPDTKRELFEAMKLIAETGHGPKEQINSIGCSIKWKQD